METSNLKPCPFCGGKAEVWRAHENPKRKAWIACMERCAVITKEYDQTQDAVTAWNHRVLEREAGNQWQPIDTAPKDRPGCLLFWLEDEGFPVKARWMKAPVPGGEDDEECWWCFEQDCPLDYSGNATHWMDMPEGPDNRRRG
jgi:Lar family restriction alleviation protein